MLYDIPQPDRHRRSRPRRCAGWPSTTRIVAVKDAKGDLAGDAPGDRAAPTWRTTPATTRSTLPLLAIGAVGVVGSPTHLIGARTKEMIEAYERGDVAARAARCTAQLLPLYTGIFRTQGVDPGQGGAAPARACRPARCGRRWSTRPTRETRRSCAPTLRRRRASTLSGSAMSQAHRGARARRRRCRPAACGSSPLGGLGAIGRNMTVFEYAGKLLIVDCGVLFPDVEQPGVDLILPDFTPILDRLDDVAGDRAHPRPRGPHRRRAVPARATSRTSRWSAPSSRWRWSRRSCAERRIEPYTLTVAEGSGSGSGRSSASSSRSTTRSRTRSRSPIRTAGRHWCCTPATSRWTSCRWTAGSPTSAGFARLGAEGVDLLLSDSTNAEIPGFVTPEREIGPVLDAIFGKAPRPDHRGLLRLARAPGPAGARRRRTSTAARSRSIGRSMVRNMGIARDLGLLRIPAGLLVSLDEATALPPDEIVLMSTGSQGEPMSALGRMATGDHRHITIEPGDTVVLASSLVPGNETAVYRVINQLSRAGATVVHKDVAKVHVSGHAPAGELLYLLNVVKPRNFMPVHGEWRHLRAHAQLGIESGVAARPGGALRGRRRGRPGRRPRPHRRPRQEPVRLRRRAGRRRRRRVAADRAAHPRRRRLHRGHRGDRLGHRQGGRRRRPSRPRASPRTRRRSTPVLPLITEALDRAAADGITDPHQLQQIVRRTVGRWVNDALPPPPDDRPHRRRGLNLADLGVVVAHFAPLRPIRANHKSKSAGIEPLPAPVLLHRRRGQPVPVRLPGQRARAATVRPWRAVLLRRAGAVRVCDPRRCDGACPTSARTRSARRRSGVGSALGRGAGALWMGLAHSVGWVARGVGRQAATAKELDPGAPPRRRRPADAGRAC